MVSGEWNAASMRSNLGLWMRGSRWLCYSLVCGLDYKIVLSGSGRGECFSCNFLTDSVMVSGMDLNAVRIISQILSQTVAMQHYESEANRLLIKLRSMLRPGDRLKGVSTLGHTRSNIIVN